MFGVLRTFNLRSSVLSVLLAVFLLAGPALASAQPQGATLDGLVTDTSGASVAHAALTLADAARGVQRQARANERGEYAFGGLPPGRYVLSVVHEGFAPVEIADIVLAGRDQRTLPVVLKVAPLSEQVSVQAAATGYTSPVTIGKRAQSLRQIPQSVTVITRQRLDDQNLLHLDQALAQSTGITISGHPTNPSLLSRGFQISTVQRDGVPLDIGNPFFVQPDMAVYDRVEVLRGAAGLFSGPGQPGGAVNLVRKRALAGTQVHASALAGSWDNYRIEADVTGGLTPSGALRGRAVATYQNRGYFFNSGDSESSVLYGRLEYDVTPRTVLSGGGLLERRDGLPYTNGLPRYTNGGDIGLDRSTFLAADWTRWDFSKPELFAEVDHRFSAAWRTRIAWSQIRETSDYQTATVFGAVDPVTLEGAELRGAGFERRDAVQNGLDATVHGAFPLFGRRHELVLGANVLDRTSEQRTADAPLGRPPVDVFHFSPAAIPEPARPDWADHTDNHVYQAGGYAMLRLSLHDRVTLGLGTRISHWRQRLRNLQTGATTQDNRVSAEATPYGALSYDLNRTWTLYGSYASIFQPQNNFTYEGELLPPIVGANYEGGLKGEWRGGALNGSLAYFDIAQTNRAQADSEHPSPCAGSPTGGCSVAQGEVRSRGVELEISGRLAAHLDLFTGYTHNTTEYVRDRTATGAPSPNEGRPFQTFVPRHMIRVWANYQLPVLSGRVGLGTGVTAQTSQYAISGVVELRQKAYGLWNARLSYDVGPRWGIAINANNLWDTTYYRALGNVNYVNHYGEPRSVTFTVRIH